MRHQTAARDYRGMQCWRTCPRDMGWARVSAPRLAHCSASGGGGDRRPCAAAAAGCMRCAAVAAERKLFFCAAVDRTPCGDGVRRSCAAAAVGRKLFFCAAVGCRSCAAAADRSTWSASSADRSTCAAAADRSTWSASSADRSTCAAAADRSTWFASSADRSTCVAACCRRRCCHRKCCPTSSRSSRWYSRCRGPPRTGNHTGSPNCTRSMSLRPRVIRPSNTPTRKPPSAGARPKCCEPCVGATSQRKPKNVRRKSCSRLVDRSTAS